MRAEILVSGRVQGVGFRRFARNAGERLGVKSNPINLRDGKVFVIAEGKPEALELFIKELRKGPDRFDHRSHADAFYRVEVDRCNGFGQAFS